jgi:hypothetical protein
VQDTTGAGRKEVQGMSMNQGTWPRPNSDGDPDKIEELRLLYVELDALEDALERAMAVREAIDLNLRRGAVLGKIKKMERERNESTN